MRGSLVASPLYSLSVLEFQESLCFPLSPSLALSSVLLRMWGTILAY